MEIPTDYAEPPCVETIIATLDALIDSRLRAGAFGSLRLEILFKGPEGITEFKITEETIARPQARKVIAKTPRQT